jgi:hypothetical protein
VLTGTECPRWEDEYSRRWLLELGALALLLAAGSFMAPLGDPDLPMHLALGEWIVRHGEVPFVEPFAWTRSGEPFYAYSWLPQAVFYLVYDAAGTVGLRVLQGSVVLLTLVSVFVLARLARWSIWTAVVLASAEALMAVVLAPYLRPHIVLLICVPLAWGFALRLTESERPWAWGLGLAALSTVVANSHLLFPIMLAPWLLLALRWPGTSRALWLVGGTAAGFLFSPYALHWPRVFALNFNDNALFTYPTPITELTPGVTAAVNGRGALLVLAVSLCMLPWAARSLDLRARIVWGAAWLAGLLSFALAARAILLWWLLLVPLVAVVIEPLARAQRGRMILVGQRLALLALVLLLTAARARASQLPWAQEIDAPRWIPTRAAPLADPLVTWLDCRIMPDVQGRAFTTFPFGTYLTWRYPRLSYSIDTRNIFPDSVALAEAYILASQDLLLLGPWRSADVAIAPFRYRVSGVLDTATGWNRALVVGAPHPGADSAGLWVRSAWWQAASDSSLPNPAAKVPSGAPGVAAACARPARDPE